jgi:hypothetical protein
VIDLCADLAVPPSRNTHVVMGLREVDYPRRMNRRVAGSRMSSVAAASVRRGHGDDADLADAVHQILATLTDLRRDTSASELRDRVALVQWLRVELAAVETLLMASYAQRSGIADATPRPAQPG